MTVTRYRKRPVEVDTIRWTGDNEAAVGAQQPKEARP